MIKVDSTRGFYFEMKNLFTKEIVSLKLEKKIELNISRISEQKNKRIMC